MSSERPILRCARRLSVRGVAIRNRKVRVVSLPGEMTEYVTTADALFFHKQLLERCGGAAGIRDVGALESALHRPPTGYYGTLIHEAAALFESLVQNHPFVDGNKRVAFAVLDVFLRINGHRITEDSNAIYGRMIELETHTFDMEHLVPWLQAIVRPAAPIPSLRKRRR